MRERFMLWENPKDAIITLMVLLMGIGCINVFSASFVTAEAMTGNQYHFLIRYIGYAAAGLAVFWFTGFKLNYKRLMSPRFYMVIAVVTILLLAATLGIGTVVNGSRRWIYIGGFSLQASEIAKVSVILMAASYLGDRLQRGLKVSLLGYPSNQALLIALAFAGLIFLQPDMGTATIVFSLMLGMYFLAGIPMRQVTYIGLIGIAIGALALMAPYRRARFALWLNPWKDAQGGGYQMAQSLTAIGSGGLTGLPWGQGSGKFFFLPEAHTDFAFAIFCQEWGYVGALFLIACFLILARALFCIAMNTKDRRGYLLVAGSTLFLIGQSAANMAMVTGVLPVIGVPLLFISYGGTSLLANMFALGLVVSVYRSECAREIMEERIAAGLPPVEEGRLRVVSSGRSGRPFR
ncbi:MAG: FtsW/RodA/SpoVE family cell cycle protein [Acidaminococcaceae bacterium]|nr:FtsW/RodA/SpoVE family cell cycle protein [Acidaminococcaceae bacterium]MBQ7418324.1 FtsW/RodA/SpoVE family cell cycle protein [Acidaminococcaceae bacterium]MBQ8492543.1 FtsW/RodA/SpoVE family cell cycle protein [Acidaminococcaceae bacterium]MBQ9256486.1 FtsW/RodA/SpoVE family cell cycle protein [Acidaminococcaceae bacterium]MBQ9283435.1 FtsW/RodA/SpoVE family cell cycle protein [Acidaminococcaceae bacterium]